MRIIGATKHIRHATAKSNRSAINSGISSGPMAFLSVGTCLMFMWLVILLPGRDITTLQQADQHTVSSSVANESVSAPPTLAPDTPIMAHQQKFRRGLRTRFHWRQQCPLVQGPLKIHRPHPLVTMSYAQAEKHRLWPCGYCKGLDDNLG